MKRKILYGLLVATSLVSVYRIGHWVGNRQGWVDSMRLCVKSLNACHAANQQLMNGTADTLEDYARRLKPEPVQCIHTATVDGKVIRYKTCDP